MSKVFLPDLSKERAFKNKTSFPYFILSLGSTFVTFFFCSWEEWELELIKILNLNMCILLLRMMHLYYSFSLVFCKAGLCDSLL